jgi:DNA repair protein RadA
MVDSPHHPEEEVIFALGEAGVMDPEEAEKKPSKKNGKKVSLKKEKDSEETEVPELELVAHESDDLEE